MTTKKGQNTSGILSFKGGEYRIRTDHLFTASEVCTTTQITLLQANTRFGKL